MRLWIRDDAKGGRGNRVFTPSPRDRQRPLHNPAGVSYACLPVAVVRMMEVEGACKRNEMKVSGLQVFYSRFSAGLRG